MVTSSVQFQSEIWNLILIRGRSLSIIHLLILPKSNFDGRISLIKSGDIGFVVFQDEVEEEVLGVNS